MHRKIRVGVFGVGSLGQHHARIYSTLPEADLIGVYDIDAQRAADVARPFGVKAFPDIDSLAERIEAASIAVPTDCHFDIYSRLAARNLHALVEKPIAATTAEAAEMVKMAQERKLVLQVGHIERFNPVMRFLEENLSNPRFIEAIRLAPYPPPRAGGLPRGTEVSVVLDLMIHDLDIILHLVRSAPKDIHAVGVPVLSPSEDIANVRISFDNGCVANITASRISRERLRKIRVFQTDTYVSLDYMKQSGLLCRKTGGQIAALDVPIEKTEPLMMELTSFLRCVSTQANPIVTGEHGRQALELAVDICRRLKENPS